MERATRNSRVVPCHSCRPRASQLRPTDPASAALCAGWQQYTFDQRCARYALPFASIHSCLAALCFFCQAISANISPATLGGGFLLIHCVPVRSERSARSISKRSRRCVRLPVRLPVAQARPIAPSGDGPPNSEPLPSSAPPFWLFLPPRFGLRGASAGAPPGGGGGGAGGGPPPGGRGGGAPGCGTAPGTPDLSTVTVFLSFFPPAIADNKSSMMRVHKRRDTQHTSKHQTTGKDRPARITVHPGSSKHAIGGQRQTAWACGGSEGAILCHQHTYRAHHRCCLCFQLKPRPPVEEVEAEHLAAAQLQGRPICPQSLSF